MNRKLIAGLSVMLVALSVSSASWAYGGRGGHCGKSFGGGGLKEMFFFKAHKVLQMEKELGLSAEQVEAVKSLKLDTKKSLIRSGAELDILKIDLYSQLKKDAADTASVEKLIDQKYEIKKAKAKLIAGSYAKLKSSLTDKQWEAFKSSFHAPKS